jgi:hypothetical protein
VEASGSLRQWMRKVVIDLIRCLVVKRLVETFMIVKAEPFSETGPQLGSVGIRSEIEVMVFERPPQSFDEDVVLDASATGRREATMPLNSITRLFAICSTTLRPARKNFSSGSIVALGIFG